MTFTISFSLIVFSTEILFFASNRNPPSPKISHFRSLYWLSLNDSENTNYRHLSRTGTDHRNSRFLKIFTFRETITHFRTRIFSQRSRFQFSSSILDGLCVSFNVHHFFLRKQFIWVDCYTGRLTFSNIILHKKAIRWILLASQAEMRKGKCVPDVVAYDWNLIVKNYWKEIL